MELTDITSIFTQVSSLQGIALLAAALVVLGYVLKGLPFVPNQIIPALVILAGGILNPLLVPRSSVSPEVGNVILHLALQGVIAGFVAWVLHNKLLSKWIDPAVFKAAPLVLCSLVLTGCLTPGTPVDCSQAAGLTQRTVQRGLSIAIATHPGIREELVLTERALATLLGMDLDDPQSLERELVNRTPGVSPLAIAAIGAGIDAYRIYAQGRLQDQAAKVACLRETLMALRAGLSAALVNAPASGPEDPRTEKLLRQRGVIPNPPAAAAPLPWHYTFGLPVVPWAECPVTPDKQRANFFMGYGDLIRRVDGSNNQGRF